MKTEFRSPFELQAGDRVLNYRGELLTVELAARSANTLGEALALRHGTLPAPQAGAAYRVTFTGRSGISGRWDGESGFKVIVEEGAAYADPFQGEAPGDLGREPTPPLPGEPEDPYWDGWTDDDAEQWAEEQEPEGAEPQGWDLT